MLKDPIGLLGDKNVYRYVKGTNSLIDPLGLAPWSKGGFNQWFNNASPQDITDNKKAVERALRKPGGKHEMFPVSEAAKARELGFTAEEIKKMTVDTDRITFVDVVDGDGNIVSGKHHSSSASWNFHDKLIKDLQKSKAEAKKIIAKHHKKHMRLDVGCK